MSCTQLHPVTTQLLPHHRLCEGDPGLLSTVQLVTVVVHQLGGGIRPLCSYLGCSAKWYGDKVAVPLHKGTGTCPSKKWDCCCVWCLFWCKIKAAGSWKIGDDGSVGTGAGLVPEQGWHPWSLGVHPALLLQLEVSPRRVG